MKLRPAFVAGITLVTLLRTAAPAFADGSLDSVKAMFTSAAYEDALLALDALDAEPGSSTADRVTSARYRALCLIALDREAEAEAALERAVRLDPHLVLDDRSVAPRVVEIFESVRLRVLPAVMQERFTAARAAFHEGSADSSRLFTELVQLTGRADVRTSHPDLAGNLELLSKGFLDLLEARVTAEPAASPVEPPRPAPVEAPAIDARPVSEVLPDWPVTLPPPGNAGRLELVIDVNGNVETATMLVSITPLYDLPLLQAAKLWKYEPATQGGVPIRSRRILNIRIDQP